MAHHNNGRHQTGDEGSAALYNFVSNNAKLFQLFVQNQAASPRGEHLKIFPRPLFLSRTYIGDRFPVCAQTVRVNRGTTV